MIELEPTSNRVDCFGVYGVAREVHAVTGADLAEAPWDEDAEATGEGEVTDYASVTVEVPELCPRFTARVFTDVQIGPSPLWLKARLIGAGMRPINNVVDITNYVMLMTAQPLHAFDLDKVPDGELIVRTAKQGEKMTTLDGVERTFDDDTVLVCDRNGPSGIAGIMGGQVSEVSDDDHPGAARGRDLERGQHPAHLAEARPALRRVEPLREAAPSRARDAGPADRLAADGRALRRQARPGDDRRGRRDPDPHRIGLRHERVERLLGMPITPEQCADYLERLDFEVERDGDDLEATVPVHRHYDVTREVDLIEEVGRIHGYAENLVATLPSTSGQAGRLTREQRLRRRAEDAMRDLGFDVVVNLSLTDPEMSGRLRIPEDDLRAQPIARIQPAIRRALRRTYGDDRLAAGQRPLQPRPRRRADRARGVRSRLPARGRVAARRRPGWEVRRGRARPPPTSHGASPALRPGPCGRVTGGARRCRPTSTRSRECSRRSPLGSESPSR